MAAKELVPGKELPEPLLDLITVRVVLIKEVG
jgi:hypothetical protein